MHIQSNTHLSQVGPLRGKFGIKFLNDYIRYNFKTANSFKPKEYFINSHVTWNLFSNYLLYTTMQIISLIYIYIYI